MCEEILRIPLKKDSLSQRSTPPLGSEFLVKLELRMLQSLSGSGTAELSLRNQLNAQYAGARPSNVSKGLETMRKSPFSMRSAPKKARPR